MIIPVAAGVQGVLLHGIIPVQNVLGNGGKLVIGYRM